jgi:hypothetical protein
MRQVVQASHAVGTKNVSALKWLSFSQQGGISGIAGDQTKRTGDKEQGIENNFDKEAVEREIAAQVAITQSFTQQAPKLVGDYGKTQLDKAKLLETEAEKLKSSDPEQYAALMTQAAEIRSAWADGENGQVGWLRALTHTVLAGLAGGIQGALGVALTSTTLPLLGEYFKQKGVPDAVVALLLQSASLALGNAVGGGAGAMTAYGTTTNNYLKHDESERKKEFEKALKQCQDKPASCTKEYVDKLKEAIAAYEKLDKARDAELKVCEGVNTATCNQARQEVRQAAADWVRDIANGDLTELLKADAARTKTLKMAGDTLDGKLSGGASAFKAILANVIEHGVEDALNSATDALALGLNAAMGSPEAQAQIAQKAKELKDSLGKKETWAALMSGMDKEMLLELAKAYETGNGEKIGEIMLHQTIHVLSLAGSVTGTGKITADAIEKAALKQATKKTAENAAKAAEQAQKIENNFYRDGGLIPDSVYEKMAEAEKTGWKDANGRIIWPPENGIVPGTQKQVTLPVGTKLDRYGEINSNTDFLAPAGTPLEQRALPPGSESRPLVQLEVLKPLPVQQSNVMPWFGQPGMGSQFQTTTGRIKMTVQQLINAGYLGVVP